MGGVWADSDEQHDALVGGQIVLSGQRFGLSVPKRAINSMADRVFLSNLIWF